MSDNITDLLLSALESNDKSTFDGILEVLKTTPITGEIDEGLSMIVESFLENPSNSPEKSSFIIELTKYMRSDFELLRTALPLAIKSFLGPDINKSTAIKVLGVKNTAVPLPVVHARFNTIIKLKKGQFFHNTISRSWAVTGDIDWMTGAIGVFDFKNSYIKDIELDSFLEKSFIFYPSKEIEKMIFSKNKPDKSLFIKLLTENAINYLDLVGLKTIAMETFVPGIFNLSEFNFWWESQTDKENSSSTESHLKFDINRARSIHELHTILKHNLTSIKNINDEKTLKHLSNVLKQIKPSSKAKDFLNWAESISILMPIIPEEALKSFVPESPAVNIIIWPTEEMNEICLETWTQLKAIELSNWIAFIEKVLGQDYLRKALPMLPWKVWPAICSKLSSAFIEIIIEESTKVTSAEMLLWMWKNREKLSSETLAKLTYSAVIPAIYRSKTGALWQTGPKELKKLLLENPDFLSKIIGKDSEENILYFIEYLNNSTALTSTDRQSIIVKLSRLSNKAKQIVNSDRVKKMIASKLTKAPQSQSSEVYLTSHKSFNEKIKELQELINKLIPENTEAIATARAHGDLRENAEYAAAKERQKFLNEHRIILESRIASTQPTDFSEIVVSDTVVAGSTIEITYDEGTTEVFHILGAWDSVPAKKYVSYDTELGRVVTGRKIGEKIGLPDGKTGTITSIQKISQSIINELKS